MTTYHAGKGRKRSSHIALVGHAAVTAYGANQDDEDTIEEKAQVSARPIQEGARLLKITPRQYEVLVLLSRGYGIREVGSMLKIPLAEAKEHAVSLYRALQVKNNEAAVQAAIDRGAFARSHLDMKDLYRAGSMELVTYIKSGVQAGMLPLVAKRLHASQDQITTLLGLPRTTISRKIRAKGQLDLNQGELLVGLMKLIGQVETMVMESGDPDGFDAAQWTKDWLFQPNHALGGKRPAELMDTVRGQEVVSQLLAQMQSGAYA
ncbi:hypothetical protein BOSP111201_08360 [Bordetella sputigena]|uniref:antitoxin Xre/MbcA/ParS toxin-binding domain-containing protein n=1 Tax=Bordetella sputigena TaxID=1416810 RepID=UPI0039EE2F86